MSRRKKILIFAAPALALAVAIPCAHHWHLRVAAEKYVAQLNASGEPMDPADIAPPPVPPEQNGVPLLHEAYPGLSTAASTDTIQLPAMRMVAPGKAMVVWQQPDIREPSWATNTWAEVRNQLVDVADDLVLLRGLIDRPALDFNLDYARGPDLRLPHLSGPKLAVRWLSSAAVHDLHRDEPAQACSNVLASLAIIKGQRNECLLISQLIRFANAGMAASVTWEILQHPGVSDGHLARLQQEWQSLEFFSSLESAFLMERIFLLQYLEHIRQAPGDSIKWQWMLRSQIDEMSLPATASTSRKIMARMTLGAALAGWQWFWLYQDEVRGLKTLQVVIDATRMAKTNSPFVAIQAYAHSNFFQLGLENSLGEPMYSAHQESAAAALRHLVTRMNYTHFKSLQRAAAAETWRNLLVTAIALRRYELRDGRLPASLAELTPDILDSVPIDPMDGNPLRYRPAGTDTFLLYSIFENGADDGGDPSVPGNSDSYQWQRARDLVWPRPATAEEVRAHYE